MACFLQQISCAEIKCQRVISGAIKSGNFGDKKNSLDALF